MAKKEQAQAPLSYFDQRMNLLGITPEINKIGIRQTDIKDSLKTVMVDVPIFRETDLGIDIVVYDLQRQLIQAKPDGSRWSKTFAITRLKEPVVKENGVMKYKIPKGAGTYPFFPPQLIEKYERKEKMKTVYMTEGYFKAFKAAMHGVDIIGLSSITHMKDRESGKLHDDITTLIRSGLVERFVWLTDGDCLDITSKEITEEKDLFTRPMNFYSSISTFKTLLEPYDDIEKWFMHINTDSIITDNKGLTRDQVKGLDDLLITFKGKEDEIIADLQSVSFTGNYFSKFNVSSGLGKIWRYFHLGDVNDFFLFHSDRRPELRNTQFKFRGTNYLYDEKKNVCEIKMPGEAKLYFRVGDDYYKFIEKPNQYGKIEKVFVERKKTTITDDHGKNFTRHIDKYEAFCNVPNHNNFQQVIHNCFNVYSPLDHVAEEEKCTEEDCPTIIKMVKHIFGEKVASFKDKDGKKEYPMWQLGLDYLQLLYQEPSQKLPILCLVSRENNTGKSTIGTFLREFLGANTAIVGNADITGDFNAHWVTKSVVVVDEAKIDKHQAIEKIKMLSTAKKVYMNAKGRGQVELDCFIKFILITNNEDTFVTATEDDIRYWVIKVPVLTEDDPDFMDKVVNEIPLFLSFLNDRKLATEKRGRMWFHPDLLKTEALRRLIQYSESTVVKELKQGLKDLFLDTGEDKIMMTVDVLQKELLPKKYERNYLANVLKDKLKVNVHGVWKVDGLPSEYESEELAMAAAQAKYPDAPGMLAMGKIKFFSKTTRYSYTKILESIKDGKPVRDRVVVQEPPSRPYVFYAKDFVTPEERASVIIDAESSFVKDTVATGINTPAPQQAQGDLPF